MAGGGVGRRWPAAWGGGGQQRGEEVTQGDTGFGKTWTASGGTAELCPRAEDGKPTLVMPICAPTLPHPQHRARDLVSHVGPG